MLPTAESLIAPFRAQLPPGFHMPMPIPCPGGWFCHIINSDGVTAASSSGHRAATPAIKAALRAFKNRRLDQ